MACSANLETHLMLAPPGIRSCSRFIMTCTSKLLPAGPLNTSNEQCMSHDSASCGLCTRICVGDVTLPVNLRQPAHTPPSVRHTAQASASSNAHDSIAGCATCMQNDCGTSRRRLRASPAQPLAWKDNPNSESLQYTLCIHVTPCAKATSTKHCP